MIYLYQIPNEKISLKESEELSSDQKKTLNRIKRGEKFEI